MPELPELNVLVENLINKIKGLKIQNIIELDKNSIKGNLPYYEDFGKITEISRKGKYIIFKSEKLSFYIHLMLSGKICLVKDTKPIYGRVEINLTDVSLIVSDKRRLAYLSVDLKNLPKGIEPLSNNFTFENFNQLLENGKRKYIKSFLMDQDLIAGIGNAYSDEIMFDAMLSPLRKIESLNSCEKKKLYESIINVLKKAIIDIKEKVGDGLEIDDDRLNLKVHTKNGEKCPRCNGRIETVKVNGKVAYYCSNCQNS